jgi:cell division protein FtsQ
MRFLRKTRRTAPVGPRKNEWKDPHGERAAKEAKRVKASRRRTLVRWTGAVVGTVLGVWGIVMGMNYAGPALQELLEIKTITIDGVHAIDKQKVLDLAKVHPGTPLHHIVTTVIRSRIESHPWIKAAEVTRLPFHELLITVTERKPAAIVRADSQNFLADEEGYVLSRLGQSDDDALPLVTGIDPHALLGETELVRHTITSCIELARLVRHTFEGRLQVHAENPTSLVALVQGVRFQFGEDALGDQWERFKRVKPTLKTMTVGGPAHGVQEVDLRYENRIIVREGG